MSHEFPGDPIETAVEVLERVRQRHPLVHCLTNHVVKNFTANALLAVQAAPAMVEHPEEAEEFAGVADALLVNLGTLGETQMEAIRRAVASARAADRPWVLDPVAVGGLTLRTRFAAELLQFRPTVVRGNASEILALAGEAAGGRGVDSLAGSEEARGAAASLAGQTGGTVVVTGAVDYVVAAGREIAVSNGDPLLTRVIGVGCAMGALIAASVAVAEDVFSGALAATLWLGIAGERAVEASQRPGSFQAALLDALDAVDAKALREQARFGGEAGG